MQIPTYNKKDMRPTYIASCSFGKDSIATILLAMEHNEPLDRIVSVEVMFDNARGISGEDPGHIQWVKEIAIPRLKELTGIDTDLIRNEKDDYVTEFFKKRGSKSKYAGKMQGFPIAGMCRINSECKVKPIRNSYKQFADVVLYIGIAADEPKRLARLTGNKVSLLAKYGYTERMAFDLCAKYGLLSPSYSISNRGGCWFCPNNKVRGFCALRDRHPELWKELQQLGKVTDTCSNYFNHDKSFAELEHDMDLMDFNIRRQLTLF